MQTLRTQTQTNENVATCVSKLYFGWICSIVRLPGTSGYGHGRNMRVHQLNVTNCNGAIAGDVAWQERSLLLMRNGYVMKHKQSGYIQDPTRRVTIFLAAVDRITDWLLDDEWTAWTVKSPRPDRNGPHFTGNLLHGSINNMPALAKAIVWRLSGNKSLSESMMAHMWIARPGWVNTCIKTFT